MRCTRADPLCADPLCPGKTVYVLHHAELWATGLAARHRLRVHAQHVLAGRLHQHHGGRAVVGGGFHHSAGGGAVAKYHDDR
jgi:hypothetical protein